MSPYKDSSVLLMRIAVGVVLIVAWQLNKLVMPELSIQSGLLAWLEFLFAVLLLFRKTVPLAGIGLVLAYAIGVYKFGLFHMLDYLLLPGVGYFFITSNSTEQRVKNSGLLMVYITLGFSLCWAGMEKLIYPQWGISLLEQHPNLALGVDESIFIQGAAFIEISVGMMFIFGYFQRLMAATVTLLFILTTMVFGSTEVIGHLVIHAALIVFIIVGPGSIFKTSPLWYRKLGRNPIFAGLGFLIMLFAFILPYTYLANSEYELAISAENSVKHPPNLEVSKREDAPHLKILIAKQSIEGTEIQLQAQNFNFVSPDKGVEKHNGIFTGYAKMTINGKPLTRLYQPWYFLPPVKPGTYNIDVSLFTYKGEMITHLGMPIRASYKLITE